MVITQKPESLDTINCVKYNQKENKRQEGTAGSPHLRLRALTSRATPAPSAGEASVGVSESIYLTLRDFSVMCTKFFSYRTSWPSLFFISRERLQNSFYPAFSDTTVFRFFFFFQISDVHAVNVS